MEPFDSGKLDAYTQAAFHAELTDAEKELRRRFVREYLVDYNAIDACVRLGFMKSFAEDFAIKFMSEPYTQQLKVEYETAEGIESDTDRDKKMVLATLRREMQNRGPGSSHAARVGAATQFAKLLGMEPATKTQTELKVTTPVQFYLPHNGRDPLSQPEGEAQK